MASYGVSRYEPLSLWMAPLSPGRNASMGAAGEIANPRWAYVMDSPVRFPEWGDIGDDMGRFVQKDCPSADQPINQWLDADVDFAKISSSGWSSPYAIGVGCSIGSPESSEEHVFGAPGEIFLGRRKYVAGYSPDQARGFCNRDRPTGGWGEGLFSAQGNVWRSSSVEKLGMAYLQPSWDSYNLIHWRGTIGSTASVQLQVCKFLEDGGTLNIPTSSATTPSSTLEPTSG